MKQVLMHICCAPDATVPVLRLRAKGYEPVGFFYDPNIHPKEEYELRLDQARKLAFIENFELIVGPYEPERWLAATREFWDEPEGGLRCPGASRSCWMPLRTRRPSFRYRCSRRRCSSAPTRMCTSWNRWGARRGRCTASPSCQRRSARRMASGSR